jgi:hypothetical protein
VLLAEDRWFYSVALVLVPEIMHDGPPKVCPHQTSWKVMAQQIESYFVFNGSNTKIV